MPQFSGNTNNSRMIAFSHGIHQCIELFLYISWSVTMLLNETFIHPGHCLPVGAV